ncbi:MAG: protein kinase [Gemmatimonadales bacterium]
MTDVLDRLRLALQGTYAVERELGAGGMATVYLAQDLKHDRPVAIKVLEPDLSASLGPERFLREIHLAAGLQHPHILTVYDSGEADGLLYYVMPYVEGESLRDRLNREQQLSIEEAVQIAREVADALSYAHSHGVVHRDIKPENVMLTGGHAVVADFGIAKAVSEAGAQQLTQTGMAVGTPAYMSPEQAAGDNTVDGRSDIYSLGCMLFEMLCGQPPFRGPTSMAIMAQHAMEAVPSLTIIRQSISDELEDAVFRAMEKVPADRFATASQFAKAISSPEATTTASRAARLRSGRTGRYAAPRPSRRRWLWAGGAVAAAGAVLLGWWRLSPGHGGVPGGPDFRRIAVLYFDDQSPNHDLQHIADGFTEALIHDLSQVDSLHVISRNGVLPYKGTAVAPESLAKALDVGTLVDGTLAEANGQLRVTVTLINAETGAEIASRPLAPRPRDDVFALQDDLANEVAVFLRRRLGKEIQLRESRAGTRNAQAWEAVQQAQELTDQAQPLADAGKVEAAAQLLVEADSQLARAEKLDGKWITPVVQRGWLAYRQSRLSGQIDRAAMPAWLDRATEYAEQALSMQADNADALELRGTVRYLSWLLNLEPDQARAERLHRDAEADLRAAVAANPSQAQAWSTLSHLLLNKSENAQAKLAAQKAYEADPFLTTANQIVWRLFQSSYDLGDPVESAHWCDEGAKRFPGDPRFVECRLWGMSLPGMKPNVPGAWRLVETYVGLTPAAQQRFARLKGNMLVAMALARAGLPDSARAVATRARGDAEVDPTRDLTLYEAIVRNLLGDRNEAFRLLSTYLAVNPHLRSSLATDQSWYLADLRNDPRYASLIGTAR